MLTPPPSTASTLSGRYQTARRQLDKMDESFKATTSSMRRLYGEKVVRGWETESTAPFVNEKGEWDSVYRSKVSCELHDGFV